MLLRGAIDVEGVRGRCTILMDQPGELAICRILPEGHDGLAESVLAQREVTAVLRRALGEDAERVAIFVSLERDVDECARQWGATVVLP